jgi:hypothetical protein
VRVLQRMEAVFKTNTDRAPDLVSRWQELNGMKSELIMQPDIKALHEYLFRNNLLSDKRRTKTAGRREEL